ncbi:unnamed protein product [Discula destructiva]
MSNYYGNKKYGGYGGGGTTTNNNKASWSKNDLILCSVDNNWERADQYSNNERKKYMDAKRMGDSSFHATCRKHAAMPLTELTCTHCDERKPLEEFSKAERKVLNEHRRCRVCVNYTETLRLYDGMPGLADHAQSDEFKLKNEGLRPRRDDESEADLGATLTTENAPSSRGPSSNGRNVELTSSILNTRNKTNLPDLGRERYGTSSALSDLGSVASAETRLAREQRPAYGPVGQSSQRASSSVAVEPETVSVANTTTVTRVPTTRSGWPKVSGRKIALEVPDLLLRGRVDEDRQPKRYAYDSSGSEDEC